MWPRDVPDDDGREFFVAAWCSHPGHIHDESVIFIPEPAVPIPVGAMQEELLGLRYLLRIRIVAYQDWSLPPDSSDAGGPGNDGEHEDDNDQGHADGHQGASHDDEIYYAGSRGSTDSSDTNCNGYQPGLDHHRGHSDGGGAAAQLVDDVAGDTVHRNSSLSNQAP